MRNTILLFFIAFGIVFPSQKSFAHCDTENGPVITAAKEALKTNNVKLVLIWVQKKDEGVIKEAFQKTIDLRKTNSAVQQVVDQYFFETLVRIHRAGEGVAYTGIEDSAEIETPIAATEAAIEKKSTADLINLLNEEIKKGVNEKFEGVISRKDYDKNDVEAGREYVESYVAFMHYVEGIYNAASHAESGHNAHELEATSTEQPQTPSNGEISAKMNANSETLASGHLTNILIIAGTLLIIIVQIVLSRRKSTSY